MEPRSNFRAVVWTILLTAANVGMADRVAA